MLESGFVYVWFDRRNKMYYIGSHWGADDDGYVCSSNWMKRAYKNRPRDFKRRIVSRISSNREGLLIEEQRWLDMIDPNKMIHASSKADVRIENVKYYNISKTAQKAWHQHDETRKTVGQRVSAGKKGKKLGIYSEDHKRRISEGKKAAFAKRRAETGQNYASTDSWKGRGKGQKLSSDHRANIGAGLYQAWASGTRKRAWRTPKITEIIPWRVISPTGEEHRVTNLKQFCVEHELTNTNITKACGSKGWRALRAACA